MSLFPERTGDDFSPCRTWRYSLWRSWDDRGPMVAFVGLNPSTADETEDDPTVRRCIGFAKKWGFAAMYMLNIFAFRATDPKVMKAAIDPIGPRNDEALDWRTSHCQLTVACWGTHGAFKDRAAQVFYRLNYRGVVKCFGLTKGGQPKHPLYLASATELAPMNL